MKPRDLVEFVHGISSSTIERVLAVGFACAFGAYAIELLTQAMSDGAPASTYLLIALGVTAAISQARRCRRLVLWALDFDDKSTR